MAVLKGFNGSIKAGGTPTLIGEVTSFTIDQTADVQETTNLGSSGWAENTTTIKRWSVSMETHFDIADGGQDELRTALAGAVVALELYLGGETGAGNASYTGNAVVESISISNEVAGIVTASISATGTGALTETALV